MDNPRITSIEWGVLEGQRPREAGANARLRIHGTTVQVPLARISTEDGATGFGACRVSAQQAAQLLGTPLNDVFSLEEGPSVPWLSFEYPLWDLVGQRTGQPVYALSAKAAGLRIEEPFTVPCYDTTLLIDDLHLATDEEAADLIADEARQGYAVGHRSFKIKVGRGARHMPLDEGTARDIAVVRAVRQAIGPEQTMMLDANNGYNLNLTKYVLTETAECNVYWIEEAFQEDRVLYDDLHQWLEAQHLPVLIADGEGGAPPDLVDWARDGVVDVIQYDIFRHGFTRWLATGRQLDAWDVGSAPHHYGSHYGNYAACHLAGGIGNFTFVEWDEVTTPGLDGSGYAIDAGRVSVPNTPGFGLILDDAVFRQAVESGGFRCSL